MSPLREQVLLQMRLRGFAAKTVEAYIYALKELCRFYRRPLETLTCGEVQRFLDEIITVRKRAWATVNVYFSAYRFLYEQVLKRSKREFSIPRRGRSGKRPGVLSREEVARLIDAPRALKHRALLAMTYPKATASNPEQALSRVFHGTSDVRRRTAPLPRRPRMTTRATDRMSFRSRVPCGRDDGTLHIPRKKRSLGALSALIPALSKPLLTCQPRLTDQPHPRTPTARPIQTP